MNRVPQPNTSGLYKQRQFLRGSEMLRTFIFLHPDDQMAVGTMNVQKALS
jgi:hypothetical protein